MTWRDPTEAPSDNWRDFDSWKQDDLDDPNEHSTSGWRCMACWYATPQRELLKGPPKTCSHRKEQDEWKR